MTIAFKCAAKSENLAEILDHANLAMVLACSFNRFNFSQNVYFGPDLAWKCFYRSSVIRQKRESSLVGKIFLSNRHLDFIYSQKSLISHFRSHNDFSRRFWFIFLSSPILVFWFFLIVRFKKLNRAFRSLNLL